MRDRIVLSMKWGTTFSAEYVNILFRSVVANMNTNFRFICLTDNDEGLDAEIEVVPIPKIGLSAGQIAAPGVWLKLALFHADVAALAPDARALFIDLDMMILGPLASFFKASEGITMLDTGQDWRKSKPVQPSTGIFSFTLGEQQNVLRAFQSDTTGAMLHFLNEQDFVAEHSENQSIWPTGAVISFKRHLARRYCLDLVLQPRCPPQGPSVLAFHGVPRPADLLASGLWGCFPHLGRGPVTWVQKYMMRYDGSAPILKEEKILGAV